MQQAITVPYRRSSPIHDVRRDLVAHAAESWSLRVTVVERDDPSAPLLSITGGLGGPAANLIIWADWDPGCRCCDYGRPPIYGATLWRGWGCPQVGLGSFDFFLPAGILYSLPQRCGWAVQLAWDSGKRADMLSQGKLHVGGLFGPATDIPGADLALLTDDSIPVHTDIEEQVLT